MNFFDKNSLWNALSLKKRELYVKKKKSQDRVVLSKPPVRGQRDFKAG
jgi:hypothetical protein